MNLVPFAIAWVVLAGVVVILAFRRRVVSAEEDDSLHVSGGGAEAAVEHQKLIAKKLDALDKWGKILTIVLAATGLILVILYLMQMWEATTRL